MTDCQKQAQLMLVTPDVRAMEQVTVTRVPAETRVPCARPSPQEFFEKCMSRPDIRSALEELARR